VTSRRADRRHQAVTTPARRRLQVALSLLRSLVTIVVLVVLYYVLPLGQHVDRPAAALLIVGMLVFTVVVVWQVRSILAASFPALRAAQALSATIPFFLLCFAAGYFIMASAEPSSFNVPLSRTDSLYFTVTVFATVGFGDIAPTSEAARVTCMVQMIADLVVLGVLLRVVLRAVQTAQRRNRPADDSGPPGAGPGPDVTHLG
jgi:voltage-gated potassium channel